MNSLFDTLKNQATDNILGVKVLNERKFAELIVRECLEIINRKEYSYHEADPLWETAQLVKDRFGIDK